MISDREHGGAAVSSLGKSRNQGVGEGERNHVTFPNSEYEILPFTRRRKVDLKRTLAEARITVGGHIIRFNTEATRWLGVYLDRGLQILTHKNPSLEKARKADDKVRRLESTNRLVSSLKGKIQIAALQAMTLYGEMMWWCEQKGWCEDFQTLVNRQRKTITGIHLSTSTSVVV